MQTPWVPELAIDLDRVRWLVARDLPEHVGEPLTVVGEGWDNLAVRVGAGRVLRLARRAVAARVLAQECRWVAQATAGLGVPTSTALRFVPATPDHPLPYAVHPWVEGETGCRAAVDFGPLAATLGAALGRLHAVPVPADAPTDTLGRADAHKRGDRAVAHLAELGEAVVPWWRELPPDDGPVVWVHGDLYGRHLVFRDGALAGIIDWGDVHAGRAATDLSVAYSFLPPEVREVFFAAYGRPVDEATRLRARAIALDYAGALIPYGRAVGDGAAEALGWRALVLAKG